MYKLALHLLTIFLFLITAAAMCMYVIPQFLYLLLPEYEELKIYVDLAPERTWLNIIVFVTGFIGSVIVLLTRITHFKTFFIANREEKIVYLLASYFAAVVTLRSYDFLIVNDTFTTALLFLFFLFYFPNFIEFLTAAARLIASYTTHIWSSVIRPALLTLTDALPILLTLYQILKPSRSSDEAHIDSTVEVSNSLEVFKKYSPLTVFFILVSTVTLFIGIIYTSIKAVSTIYTAIVENDRRNKRESLNPKVEAIEPHLAYRSTKVILYGKGFGWKETDDVRLMSQLGEIKTDFWNDNKIVYTVSLDTKIGTYSVWIEKKVKWEGKEIAAKSAVGTVRVIPVLPKWSPEDDAYFSHLETLRDETLIENGYDPEDYKEK